MPDLPHPLPVPPPAPEAERVAVSAFVVCRDESAMIGDCLASLRHCREIVVVDSGSTDGTLDLVRRYAEASYPIRLLHREWDGFATQKQYALDAARGPWCLSLDADERLDEDMQRTLAHADLDRTKVAGYRLLRRDYLPGYGYAPRIVAAKSIMRLVRKDRARFDLTQLIHESIEVDGPVATLGDGTILHHRAISLHEEARKANDYAQLKARQRLASGRQPSLLRLVFNPPIRFLSVYLMQRYFVCGRAGLIYAGILGYYTFLTEANHYRLSVSAKARR